MIRNKLLEAILLTHIVNETGDIPWRTAGAVSFTRVQRMREKCQLYSIFILLQFSSYRIRSGRAFEIEMTTQKFVG